MQGLNRIFLLGYLGSEPQLYSTKSGRQYAGLSLATHRIRGGAEDEGERKEATDWHFVRVWGKQAETCTKYLTKGQPVMVEGYLTQYTQVQADGSEPRKRTGINAIKVEFLPRAIDSSSAN